MVSFCFALFHFNRRDLRFCFLRKEEPKAQRAGVLERTPIRWALGSGGREAGRDSPPSAGRAPAGRAGDRKEHRATRSLRSTSGHAARGGEPGALRPSVRLCSIYSFVLCQDRRLLPRPPSDEQPRPGQEQTLSWPLLSWGAPTPTGQDQAAPAPAALPSLFRFCWASTPRCWRHSPSAAGGGSAGTDGSW